MSKEETEKLRHSAAHVLAQAVLRLYPNTKLGIGPVTDTGYCYDFDVDFPEDRTEREILDEIEREMQIVIDEDLLFTQITVEKGAAQDMLHQQGQIFKSELLQTLDEESVSFYKTGEEFIDLCRGPHVSSTGKISAIKLIRIESAHWLGDNTRPQLKRIVGVAFASQEELEKFEQKQVDLQQQHHEKLNEKLQIFDKLDRYKHITLLHKGSLTRKQLQFELEEELTSEGYEIYTPTQVAAEEYIEKHQLHGQMGINDSGILGNVLQIIDLVRKYNKPSNLITFATVASEATVKSDETNLYNCSHVTQQLSIQTLHIEEILQGIELQIHTLLQYYRNLLDIKSITVELIADTTANLREGILGILLGAGLSINESKRQIPGFQLKIQYRDQFSRKHELASILYNENISAAVSKYIGKDKSVFLYTILVRSYEALLGQILEYTGGSLPYKIAPYQVIVLPKTSAEFDYSRTLINELKLNGVRAIADYTDADIADKKSKADDQRYPYILTIGEAEVQNNAFLVKPLQDEELGLMTLAEFLQKLI